MLLFTKLNLRTFVFLFFLSTTTLTSYGNPSSGDYFLEEGKRLMNAGEYTKAIEQFQEYVSVAGAKKSEKEGVYKMISTCANNNYLSLNQTDVKITGNVRSSYENLFSFYKNLAVKRLLLFTESDEQLEDHKFITRSYHTQDKRGQVMITPNTDFFMAKFDAYHEDYSSTNITNDINDVFTSSYGDIEDSDRNIYQIKRLPKGLWALPKELPSIINSDKDENYPFYDESSQTLYFSSKGHNSMGGYDIFKSTYNTETNSWSTPENMGVPINSVYDDIAYIPSTDCSEGAYFASTRNKLTNNELTVYKVQLPGAPRYRIIKGKINIKESSISVFDTQKKSLVGIYTPSTPDGKYIIALAEDSKQFVFQITSKLIKSQSNIITIPNNHNPDDPLYQNISYNSDNNLLSFGFKGFPQRRAYNKGLNSRESNNIKIKKARLASQKSSLIADELNKLAFESDEFKNQIKISALQKVKEEEALLELKKVKILEQNMQGKSDQSSVSSMQAIEKQLYELKLIDIDTMLFNNKDLLEYHERKKESLMSTLNNYETEEIVVDAKIATLTSGGKNKLDELNNLKKYKDNLMRRFQFVQDELRTVSYDLNYFKEEQNLVKNFKVALETSPELKKVKVKSRALAVEASKEFQNYNIKGLYYSIQVGVHDENISLNIFKNLAPLFKTKKNNNHLSRYTIGRYNNISDAKKAKEIITKKGIPNSFIIAIYNDKRINVSEAVKLEKVNAQKADIFVEHMNKMPYTLINY